LQDTRVAFKNQSAKTTCGSINETLPESVKL